MLTEGRKITIYNSEGQFIGEGTAWDYSGFLAIKEKVVQLFNRMFEAALKIVENLRKSMRKFFLKQTYEKQIIQYEEWLQKVEVTLKYAKQSNARRKLLKRKVLYANRLSLLKKEIEKMEEDEE